MRTYLTLLFLCGVALSAGPHPPLPSPPSSLYFSFFRLLWNERLAKDEQCAETNSSNSISSMAGTTDSFAGPTAATGAATTPAFTPQMNPLQQSQSPAPQLLPTQQNKFFDEAGAGSSPPPPFFLLHTDPPVLDRSHSYCEAMDYHCDATILPFRQLQQQQQRRQQQQQQQQQRLSAAVADVLQQVAHLTVEGNHSDEDKDANDNDNEDWRLEKWTWGGTGERTLGACIEGGGDGGDSESSDPDGVGAAVWGVPPPPLALSTLPCWQTPPALLPGSVGTTSLHSAAAAAAAAHYSSQQPPPSAHHPHHKRMLSGSSSVSGAPTHSQSQSHPHALWNPYSWSSSFASSPYPTASSGSSSHQGTQQQQLAQNCHPQDHQHRSSLSHNTHNSNTKKKQRSGSFILVQTAPHLPLSPELPDDLPTPLTHNNHEEDCVGGHPRRPMAGEGEVRASNNDDDVGANQESASGGQPSITTTTNANVRYQPRRPLHFPPPLFSPLRWAATPSVVVAAPPYVLPSAVLPGGVVDADSGADLTGTPSVPGIRPAAGSSAAETPQPLILPPPPPMPLMTSPSPPTRRQILRMRRADAIRLAL